LRRRVVVKPDVAPFGFRKILPGNATSRGGSPAEKRDPSAAFELKRVNKESWRAFATLPA